MAKKWDADAPLAHPEAGMTDGEFRRWKRNVAQARKLGPVAPEEPPEPPVVETDPEVLAQATAAIADGPTNAGLLAKSMKVLNEVLDVPVGTGSRSVQSARIQVAKGVVAAEATRRAKAKAEGGVKPPLTDLEMEQVILDVERDWIVRARGSDPAALHELEVLSAATTRRILDDVTATEKAVNVLLNREPVNADAAKT